MNITTFDFQEAAEDGLARFIDAINGHGCSAADYFLTTDTQEFVFRLMCGVCGSIWNFPIEELRTPELFKKDTAVVAYYLAARIGPVTVENLYIGPKECNLCR